MNSSQRVVVVLTVVFAMGTAGCSSAPRFERQNPGKAAVCRDGWEPGCPEDDRRRVISVLGLGPEEISFLRQYGPEYCQPWLRDPICRGIEAVSGVRK